MELMSFASFAGARFGQGADSLLAELGAPDKRATTEAGVLELDYGHAIYRFGRDGRLFEITGDAESIVVNGIPVGFDRLADYLEENDAGVFRCYGFFVSPRLGLMHDPDFPSWVTAIREDAVAGLRALAG